jgi:hypothetical protein
MEWAGLSLGLLGLALGIIPLALAQEIPRQLHAPLLGLAGAFLIAGLGTGLEPLRRPIALGYLLRFGRFPFLFVYLFADMFLEGKRLSKFKTQARFALQDDYASEPYWSEIDTQKMLKRKLTDAAIDGRLELYGRLVAVDGSFGFLTRIPVEHLRTHDIETLIAKNQLSNKFVYTYDAKLIDAEYMCAPIRSGCYRDLYVSRNVKMVLRQ